MMTNHAFPRTSLFLGLVCCINAFSFPSTSFSGASSPASLTGRHSSSMAKWTCQYLDDEGMKTAGDRKKGKKKATLFAPATSLLPWREYRATLHRSEMPWHLRKASRESGIWCHEIPLLEPGCLLIESPAKSFAGESFDHPEMEGVDCGRRVILLVKHASGADGGSLGIVLNQPTPMLIGDLTNRLPDFGDNTIHIGGHPKTDKERENTRERSRGQLYTVHSVRGLKGGEELQDGVFFGADVRQALNLVQLGVASPEQFRFFYGAIRWEAGKLEKEIAAGEWVAAAACKEVSLRPSGSWEKPLWRLLLEVLGGRHSLMARETYGEI